jgi:NAD(P)-dependent dehydrogenase (short-subunit alcohol dehydrogenase family)
LFICFFVTEIGGAAHAVQADTASSADVDRLFAETKRIYGRVDIVIANAGKRSLYHQPTTVCGCATVLVLNMLYMSTYE